MTTTATTIGRLPVLLALCVLLNGVTACGESSGGVSATGGGSTTGYVYVLSQGAQDQPVPGAIYQYAIAANGSLVPLPAASLATGTQPVAIAADPTGSYVYVVDAGAATISQYAVGAAGALTALEPSTVGIAGATPGDTQINGITVDPDGGFVYVVETSTVGLPAAGAATGDSLNSVIAGFSIGSDGALTPLPAPAQTVTSTADGPLVIAPGGGFAYLGGLTGVTPVATSTAPAADVLQYSLDTKGTLAALAPPAVSVTAAAAGFYVLPTGSGAYSLATCVGTACGGQLIQYEIAAQGNLVPSGNSADLGAHVNPIALLASALGTNLYLLADDAGVDTQQGVLLQYSIGAQGVLVPGSSMALPAASAAVAIGTYGSYVYALSANALAEPPAAPPGGNIAYFTEDAIGALSNTGNLELALGYPVGMAIVAH